MIRRVTILLIASFYFAFHGPSAQDNTEPEADAPGDFLIGAQAVLDAVGKLRVDEAPSPSQPDISKARVLTLRNCVDIALAQNPQALMADADVDVARAAIGQARSGMFPQIKLTEGLSYDPNIGGAFGGSSFITDLIFSSDLTGDPLQRSDQVTIEQVLYAGGQIRSALRAARYLAKSQEWQRRVTLDTITFDTRQAYYDCLLSTALVHVAERSVVTFQRHRDDAQHMADVGMVSGFEVLRAKTELGARDSDVVAAKNGERIAYINLRRILSIPQDAPILLRDTLEWQPLDRSTKEFIEVAHGRRPELLALDAGIAAARADVRRVRGEFRPQIGATGQWTNLSGVGSIAPDGFTASVGLEFKIYDGGKRRHAKAEAKARLRSLEYQREDLRQLVEFDVRQAYIRVGDAIAKIRSEKGTVELATEGQRLASLRFQEGVGTQAEVLDAELASTNAETALVQALRDYAVAVGALDRATGKAWETATTN